MTDSEFKSALVETSLLHLFVVSGSHLLLLEQLLSFLPLSASMRIFLWFGYTLACGWQPPLVRALLAALLGKWERRGDLFWPADLRILWAGLLSLVLFPTWMNSHSLLMSWSAALALSASSLLPPMTAWQRAFLMGLLIYLLMLPLLWGFGNLHPLSILFNLLLAPLVTLWLLPLALASVFIPALAPLLSSSCAAFLELMQKVSDPIEISRAVGFPVSALWAFLLFLHLGFHILRLHQRQGKI